MDAPDDAGGADGADGAGGAGGLGKKQGQGRTSVPQQPIIIGHRHREYVR